MIKNYFKVAVRNLFKNKVFSFINITGLAIGLACFLLIALFVTDELSFDKYHEKAARIYRVDAEIKFGGNELLLAVSSDPMGATLKKDYPEVEQYTRIYNDGNELIKKETEFINENNVVHVDSTFFDVFTLPAIAGDTRTALNEPNTVVITESMAKKYFGTTEALGKMVEKDGNPFKVTAVIKDVPKNSHFHFNMMFSMDNVEYGWGNYLSNNFQTYIVLKKGTDPAIFNKNFDQVLDKYVLPQAKQYMQIGNMDEFRKSGNKLLYYLTPLTDIHLHSNLTAELSANGNIQYVYIFSAVALFILLIACINFMNLSTARSANRAREVGIRKVLGTKRKSLILQFLTESFIMSVISMILAVCIVYLVLPIFNEIAGKEILFTDIIKGKGLLFVLATPIVVGLFAGSYPAFFLSGFKPIEVLKGKLLKGKQTVSMRSALVVFQFATSIILIIGTIVIYNQLTYIQNKKVGFNKDQVLIINNAYSLDKKLIAFKNEILRTEGVSTGTITGFLPVNSSRNDNSFSTSPVMDSKNAMSMQNWEVDYDYITTLGMEVIKGRDFSKEFGTDSMAMILNESAAKVMGTGDPVGKKLYSFNQDQQPIVYTVIGVVKNFNYESLRQNIGPLSLRLGNHRGLISFKINTDKLPNILAKAEKNWKSMAPGMPFSYDFLDESFVEMYRAEMRVGKIAMIFSLLAILIACLGLFGLATFMAEQRTREIGIRKVLGANVQGIVRLLSADFIKLVLLSFTIAVPVAWWFMHKWLEDFAYRIHISFWVFIIAGLVTLLIALATVSFQAIRAAIANPVKSLRTE